MLRILSLGGTKVLLARMRIGLVITFLVVAPGLLGHAVSAQEVINTTAMGTSTQRGKNINLKVIIYSYSTPEDGRLLDQAFQQGQNDGVVKTLSKMKPVGRIQIPGRG